MSRYEKEKKPLKKRRRRRGRYICGFILITIAAWFVLSLWSDWNFDGIGWGLGGGWGFRSQNDADANGSLPTTRDAAQDAQQGEAGSSAGDENGGETPEAPAETERVLRIDASEGQIIYDGRILTLDELEELLLTLNRPDDVWDLRDNHAKKALYDQIKALLVECAVAFTES